jgi:hypothetical protein
VYGLESAALDALGGAEEVRKALTTITDAHEAQLSAAEDTGQDHPDSARPLPVVYRHGYHPSRVRTYIRA